MPYLLIMSSEDFEYNLEESQHSVSDIDIEALRMQFSKDVECVVPAVARRRRRAIEIAPRKPVVKRNDNVPESDSERSTVSETAILMCQVINKLRTCYAIQEPEEFLDAMHYGRAEIVGSFCLETLLGESYSPKVLTVCGSEVACAGLREYLPAQYKCEGEKLIDLRTVGKIYRSGDVQIELISLLTADEYRATLDITILQNKFNGKKFIIGDQQTLKKCGTVIRYSPDTVKLYFSHGFKLQLTLTADIACKLFI